MNRRNFIQSAIKSGVMLAGMNLFGKTAFAAQAAKDKKADRTMKILVLTGSPRKNGNSSILADEFIKGAAENGHDIFRFDAAQNNVRPCIACNSCGMDGPCVFRDDFETVRKHIVPADMVVFATPMYYFGISSQLKAVIDRFYALNGQIHAPKQAALLMTYANTAQKQAKPITSHYEVLLDYLGWKDAGRVIAPGVWTPGSIKSTGYPQQAYNLGKSIG